ncbi:hypothetical protein CCR96_09065 [Halochromatium roseum]|nr:hypothetical protein [Halochromatium roseum]
MIALIDQIADRDTALQSLESLLRYDVQGTQRVEEDDARRLLEQTAPGDPIMQIRPHRCRLRQQIQEADAETLLEWSDRILTAETPEAVFH